MLHFLTTVKQITLMTGLILLILISFTSYVPSRIMRINVLDVGQGDSIYVESMDGYSILIDVGFDNSVVFELPKIQSGNKKFIDYLVITHYDFDHVGGLTELLMRYEIGTAFLPYLPAQDDPDYKVIEILDSNRISFEVVDADEYLDFGCCATIDFVWPKDNVVVSDSNDSSVGVVLTYQDFDIYMAGDLSLEYEIESLEGINKDFEVFKLGHHGSRTSTSATMLDQIRVEYGIISAGLDNKYGHPHKEVLELLTEYEVVYLTTYENGNIQISTDGFSYSIDY
jgi:competence protein ComEC